MKSKAEIYTTILTRALKYIDGEKKMNISNIIIKEYMENHHYAEPLEFEFEEAEDLSSEIDRHPLYRQKQTSGAGE